MSLNETLLRDVTEYLRSLALRYFRPHEFLVKCENKSNTLPPRRLWGNIAHTARILDMGRERLGAPLVITSCYRSPAYNKTVGGANKSTHVQFQAADVQSPTASAEQIYNVFLELRREGAFKGGIGFYPGRFVHVDTRGSNATWFGRS